MAATGSRAIPMNVLVRLASAGLVRLVPAGSQLTCYQYFIDIWKLLHQAWSGGSNDFSRS